MVDSEEATIANRVEGDETAVGTKVDDVAGIDTGRVVGELSEPSEALQNLLPEYISLTPPDDCIEVTQDGGVLKKILQPGESDVKPSMHARCLVHYVGYLVSGGEVFMNTRMDRETEEPVVLVAGRSSAAQETGLCLAAATMSRGERALVYVMEPKYGYGSLGSFSFPSVPPHSQLVYEVELINWDGVEEADNDQDRGALLFEERLERAERRRVTGNQLYKEGQYKEALAKYALALSYMDEDFMYQLEGRYLDAAEAVKLKVHLNMAAAQIKTGDFNTAIYNCGQVINIDPQNVKALFRRGKSRLSLGRTEEAQQDLEAAAKIDPASKEIQSELRALKATIKKERQAQAALFTGLYNSPGVAPSDTSTSRAFTSEAPPDSAAAPERGPVILGGSSATQGQGQQLSKRTGVSYSGAAAAGGKQSRVGTRDRGSGGSSKQLPRNSAASAGSAVLARLGAVLAWFWGVLLAAFTRSPVQQQRVETRRSRIR